MTTVIVSAARTPFGKLLGALSSLSAADLGGHAISAAIAKAGIKPDQVSEVFLGHVIQAGTSQSAARKAAAAAGLSLNVPATSINKVCLSGINSIALAHYLISANPDQIIVAGGMESMTNAPHLLPNYRKGIKYGNDVVVDSMQYDALLCSFEHLTMGSATDNFNPRYQLSREAQDEIALLSHQRAAAATESGLFDAEIAPIQIGENQVSTDEGIRANTDLATLAKLKPAFNPTGTITAGNASSISDGAAAVVMMSKTQAEKLGLNVLAEIVSHGSVAGPDTALHEQPANAIEHALGKANLKISDLDLVEINEAFAAVSLVSMNKLGITSEITNVNGGAIAIGHPVGASGARLVTTLIHELIRRGGGVGAAALCGGTGQGDALILKV
ncbi:MAG: acetyl-CoA C-acetyltransferase [Candidatus Nanopelagicales bacterium]